MRFAPATERKFHKQFIGDFIFDLERDQFRHRLFLERNVMRVLAHHQKRQASVKAAATDKSLSNGVIPPNLDRKSTELSKRPIADADSKRGSLRNLQAQFPQEDAELVLELKSIRKKLNFTSNQPQNDERPKKRIRLDEQECQCHVAVWDNREGFRSPEPIVKRSQFCTITARDGPSGTRAVDIEMDEPFIIKARDLFVPVKSKGVLRLAVGDKYFLETKIIPCQSSGDWPPIPILSKSDVAIIREEGKKTIANIEGVLVASYANLPHAPAAGVPLSVAFVQSGRTFKSKYGLEVSSTWRQPNKSDAKIKVEKERLPDDKVPWYDGSPSEKLSKRQKDNKFLNKSSKALSNGLPQITSADKIVQLSYIWDVASSKQISREFRTTSLEGFCCAVCRKKEFRTLKELQFHLINTHHKYKVRVESEEKDPVSDKLSKVVLKVEFAEIIRRKASNFVKDDREMDWEAPKRPFDIDAYIKGDHTWVGIHPRRRGIAKESSSADSSAPPNEIIARKPGFLPPSEVLEIPTPRRKRHKVVPSRTKDNMPLFRSISHRTIRVDESPLSESDDDIDDTWLQQKHSDTIAERDDLTEAQKEFRQRYDLHMMAEKFPSGRYVSDSIVRFVRANKTWLQEPNMLHEFNALMQTLKERGLIDDRVFIGCARIIWSDDDLDADTMIVGVGDQNTAPLRGRKALLDKEPTAAEMALKTASAPLPKGPATYGSCGICFKYITRKKLTICCTNPDCKTPGITYHLACVGRLDRDSEWICKPCAEDAKRLELRSLADQ